MLYYTKNDQTCNTAIALSIFDLYPGYVHSQRTHILIGKFAKFTFLDGKKSRNVMKHLIVSWVNHGKSQLSDG